MTEVKKMQKVPMVCDTMLWDGTWESAVQIIDWMSRHGNNGGMWSCESAYDAGRLTVDTLEGRVDTGPGSLIVKGIDDEFWPVADGIWQRTYEDVKVEKKRRWFRRGKNG